MSWGAKGNIDQILPLLEAERDRMYRGVVERTIIEGQLEAIRALPSCVGGDWWIQAYGHINGGDGEKAGSGSNACVDARFVADDAESPF